MVASPPKPTAESAKSFAKQPVEKQKELRFFKALPKDNAEGSTTPYCFDVLAQLANIPARITLYELLRLSKSKREALREALADAEIFMAQISTGSQEEDEEDCLHASQNAPCITFTTDDMQVKGNMIGPCTSQGILDHLR